MGSDDLFHKRKTQTAQSLNRKKAKRSSYNMILIVCEGEKTEPNYFSELIDDLRLNTANIKIVGNNGGSAPISIVDFALTEYKKEKEYDRVYCVFDKDQHESYDNAIDKIKRAKLSKGHKIQAITSVPCFEFWLLLHYKSTTKQFGMKSGSICASVISDLEKHIPSYAKGDRDIYKITKTKIETAIENSKKVEKHCKSVGTDMPSTKVYELVEYLRKLKKWPE